VQELALIAVLAAFAIVGMVVVPKLTQPDFPITPLPPRSDLPIDARRTTTAVSLRNRGTYDWRDCTITLNATRFQNDPSESERLWTMFEPHIGAGRTMVYRLSSFRRADGTVFDPVATAVTTLLVKCETPYSQAWWLGRLR
jgi:hypothetical protein